MSKFLEYFKTRKRKYQILMIVAAVMFVVCIGLVIAVLGTGGFHGLKYAFS